MIREIYFVCVEMELVFISVIIDEFLIIEFHYFNNNNNVEHIVNLVFSRYYNMI